MKLSYLFLTLLLLLAVPSPCQCAPRNFIAEWDASIEEVRKKKNQESDEYIKKAVADEEKADKLNSQERADTLKEAVSHWEKASKCYSEIIQKINSTGDKIYQESLINFRTPIDKNINDIGNIILQLKQVINRIEAELAGKPLLEKSDKKAVQAASLFSKYAFPTHLKDIDASISHLNEAAKLYQDAQEGYNEAYEVLRRHSTGQYNRYLKQKTTDYGNAAAGCRTKAEELAEKKPSKIFILKEQLALLKNGAHKQQTRRQLLSILQELVDVGEDDEEELALLKEQETAFQLTPQNQEEPKLFDEPFSQREKKRKEYFFSRLSFISNTIDPITTLHNVLSKKAPYVIPLDVSMSDGETNAHYSGQFYRLFFETDSPTTHFTVKVYEEGREVYQEKIPLPIPGTLDWDTYLVKDGMVSIPKTVLKTKYGLDLRLKVISDKTFLVSIKGYSNYQFSLYIDEKPLYSFYFNDPPPLQLEVLCKPALPSTQPLLKPASFIIEDLPSNYPKFVDNHELISHDLLDQLVEELKNDPLAIAQYVQNEIDLVDPFLTITQNQVGGSLEEKKAVFCAPYLHKSALGTFLEGQGSPWEQCALLNYLLKKAGQQTLYAQTKCALPSDYVERLLSIQLEEKEKEVILEYPFVFLKKGDQWISLFPWMKNIQVTEGYDLYSLMPAEYAGANRWIQRYLSNDNEILKHKGLDQDDTAGVLFIRFVEEQLRKQSLSIEDVGAHRSVIKQSYTNWEEFPRPKLIEAINTSENLDPPLNLFAKLKIEIFSSESPRKKTFENWSLPYLNGRFVAIDFIQSDNENSMTFSLKNGSDNETVSTSKLFLNPDDRTINIRLIYEGGFKFEQTLSIVNGTKAALCFSFGNGTDKGTSFFAGPYFESMGSEGKLLNLLAFTGARYFEKCSRAQKQLASLHKIRDTNYFNFGLAKLAPASVTAVAGSETDLKFPQVDMYFREALPDPSSLSRHNNLLWSDYYALVCADFSSNEHQVIHDIFDDPFAISTVKLLQIAHKKHQEKNLYDLGFLALTKRTHAEATEQPFLSKFLNFPHLPDLNFEKVLADEKIQWNAAGELLNRVDQSVVFMTPGPVSSENRLVNGSPFYTGMGTMILSSLEIRALISDATGLINGGFGSGLLLKDLNAFDRVKWNLYSTKLNSIAIEDWLNKPITSGFENNHPKLEEKRTPTLWVAKWTADVRQFFKPALNTVSDPVDVVTGAFYIDEVDLTLPGPFPLEIRRNYSNQNSVLTSLGHRWKLSLNPQLHEEEDKLYAAEEDGSVIVYRRDDSSSKWIVFPEDNPDLYNSNKKGIGSSANPYHAFIVQDKENYILFGSDGSKRLFKNHLLSEWTNPAGHTLTFSYIGEQLKEIESSNGSYIGFCYNFEGKMSEAYVKDGRRTYYYYNSLGDLCKIILPNGAEVDYVYDSSHQIVRETKPNGRVLENTYDEKGRVIEQRSPVGPQQEMVASATFIYEDDVTKAIDASGATTEYKIFQKQIYKITDPQGFITFQSWFIDESSYFDAEKGCIVPFDQSGGCARSLKSTQDKRGLITEYRYDSNGNPIKISLIGEDLTGLGDQKITKYLSYNELNLLVQETAVNKVTRTIYDDQLPFLPKRIENFIDHTPLSFIEFTYENGLLKQENRSGAITCWAYDKRGFPIEISQETGVSNLKVVTTFNYNEQGQCVEKKAQDGMERNIYDIMGNRLQRSVLDLKGNVLSTTYAGYNLNNQIAWQQGPDPRNTLFLDYNANGQLKASRQSLTSWHGKGVTEAGVAYRLYDYDTRGHLIEEVNPLGHPTFREYDALGRVSKETIDGLTSEFSYEAGGMVATILSPNGGKTSRFYTTNGLLKKEIYPDGTESSCVYDYFGRPVLQSKNGMTWEITYDDILNTVTKTQRVSGITEISRFDARGNLIASTDAEGYTWTKSYDLLNRKVAETDPEGYTTTWSYGKDTVSCTLPSGETTTQRYAASQLIESTTINAQGDLLSHQLIRYYPEQSTVEEISGNIITTTQTNTLGQPLIVQQGELITTYQYDHSGRCIASTDGEGRTTTKRV